MTSAAVPPLDRADNLPDALSAAGGRQFSIGRDAGCDVVLADTTVSRRHAELRFRDGRVVLADCGSTGGTWLIRDDKAAEVRETLVYGGMVFQFNEVTLSAESLLDALRKKHPSFEFRLPVPPDADTVTDTLPMDSREHVAAPACPSCGRPGSFKQYTIVQRLVFVFLAYDCRFVTLTACPACLRSIVLKRTLSNLIPANIAWPFVVLPWHILAVLKSFGASPGRPREGPGALPEGSE